MPISATWDEHRPHVINIKVAAPWTWEMIFVLEGQMIQMGNKRPYPVYLLFDGTQIFNVPPVDGVNGTTRLANMFVERGSPVRMGVVFGVSDVVQYYVQALIRRARAEYNEKYPPEINKGGFGPQRRWLYVRYTSTRAEALNIIDADYRSHRGS